MKLNGERRLIGLELAYVVLMPIAVSALAGWRQMPDLVRRLFDDHAAAWWQAGGSVVAIFISIFGVMFLQDRERKRAALQARVEWLEAVEGVATACDRLIAEQHALTYSRPTGAQFKRDGRPKRLATVCRAISAVNLDRAHPAELAISIIELQHVTSKAHRLIAGAADGVADHERVMVDLEDCADRSAKALRTVRDELAVASAQLR